MSVLSFMKKSRQAAKEHAAKQAEKAKAEQTKTPYKHIPSHAAIDALSGGPATWRDADRPKILEQNRRRSAMTASGLGMSGTMTPVHQGMPRVSSSLSHVSYPSAYASPHVHIPRAYSYSSMATPGWSQYGGEVNYTPMPLAGVPAVSGKGKEVERIMVDSGRASRASSHGSTRGPSPPGGSQSGKDMAVSPVGSSSNSTSSQDDLEMKPSKHAPTASKKPPSAARPFVESETLHRLHPSHSRRISDSHQAKGSTASPRYGNSRNSSSASLAAAGIPPVPALPTMPYATGISSSLASSSASSTASSITVVPGPNSSTLPNNKAPAPVPVPIPSSVVDERGEQRDSEAEVYGAIGIATTEMTTQNSRRTSKYTRFSELETISSDVSADVKNLGSTLGKVPTITTVTALPTTFDESSLPSHQPELPPPRTGGKLSKTLSKAPSVKPAKKNRWSFRSSKSTAVAV
ncbi:hypothetical protein V8F20_002593 [Naviculisporaceae sp. PSN 640]